MNNVYDVIIIGAGPAGMTAAIYASRGGLRTLMIDGGNPGGKLLLTHKIENWPGITSISGEELAKQMFAHSTAFGAEFINDFVVKLEDGEVKTIVGENGRYQAHFVIIAAGMKERKLKIKDGDKYSGRGLSYCAVCDAPFCRDEIVTVVGGSNLALEEALYISQFAKQVNLVNPSSNFRAEKTIISQVENEPKINLLTQKKPLEIVADDKGMVTGLTIEDTATKESQIIDTYMIFPYVGSDASTAFLEGMNIYAENGYIKTNEDMETPVLGIYSVGDVNDKELRQIVTAASDGAIAAQAIIRTVKRQGK